MGDGQASRTDPTAAPRENIEIEHPRSPAATRATAEIALDRFERGEHRVWVGNACDQHDRIGKISPGAALRRVEDDRRGVEQAEVRVEPGDGGADHAAGAAVATVRAVGAERDGVEVRCLGQVASPRSG